MERRPAPDPGGRVALGLRRAALHDLRRKGLQSGHVRHRLAGGLRRAGPAGPLLSRQRPHQGTRPRPAVRADAGNRRRRCRAGEPRRPRHFGVRKDRHERLGAVGGQRPGGDVSPVGARAPCRAPCTHGRGRWRGPRQARCLHLRGAVEARLRTGRVHTADFGLRPPRVPRPGRARCFPAGNGSCCWPNRWPC